MSEQLKGKIIRYALNRLGINRLSVLDGMTLEYYGKWYNIYVDGNKATVEEI